MQKFIITGNLTNEPAQTEMPSGKRVTNFTLAVNRRFKQDGEKVTDFFRIAAWGTLGDLCLQYLHKGNKAGVIGELQPRTYENKEGKTVMSLDVMADEVDFPPKGSDVAADQEKPKKERNYTEADFTDCVNEDVPF